MRSQFRETESEDKAALEHVTSRPGMVVHTYNPRHLEGRDRKTAV
jgi:hypothetical protein